MEPTQTPRPDDSGGRASMVKQNPNSSNFQARPQGPPGAPRFPINNGSAGGPRLIGQPPPNLHRLDSRTSLGPNPNALGQFVQPRPFVQRPASAGAPNTLPVNYARSQPPHSANPLNQGPLRFPPQSSPGIRGPYPPTPQRLPFNQQIPQNIRPRPIGPPSPINPDIRQPPPRIITEVSPTGVPKTENLSRTAAPVVSARMNSEKNLAMQGKEKMEDNSATGKIDDTSLVKKKNQSRNENGDNKNDDDDDDDVVMDIEKSANSPVKIATPQPPKSTASSPLPPEVVVAPIQDSDQSEVDTENVDRPASRVEPPKTPETKVEEDKVVIENETTTPKSRPQSVKSLKSPLPGGNSELLHTGLDSRSATPSPNLTPNVLGFDDGKPRSLSPKSPVPQSPSPTSSPLISSTPKSPGTPKSETDKKKTTFADDVEDKNDVNEVINNVIKSPSRPGTTVISKSTSRPATPAAEKSPSRPGTTVISEKPQTRPTTPASEKSATRPTTPATSEKSNTKSETATDLLVDEKPDPPPLPTESKSARKRTTSARSTKSDADDIMNQTNAQPTTNGVTLSPTKKLASKSREGDKSKTAASPVKSPSKSIKSLPRTPEAGPPALDKKKVPMNKVQVGSAPSPNLKTIRSKVGSLENTSYKPGGGKVKIENRKLDFSNAQPKIAAKNEKYTPSGGDKKITQVKLQWNAKPKVGSLDNATYKPGGGDKKIETVKLDFKDKAKSRVGSKDNVKHTPGGGTVKSTATPPKTPQDVPNDIETQKIDIKAESKVGSLDNVKYRPGGGDKKIFDDKDYLRQMSPNVQSVNGSGTQENDDLNIINGNKDPNPPPSTPTKSPTLSITSPVTPEALKIGLRAKTPDTPKKVTIAEYNSPQLRVSSATINKITPTDTPTPRSKSPKSPETSKSRKSSETPKSPKSLHTPKSRKSPVKSPISPRPPSSLDLKSPEKSSASSSRKSSPHGFVLPKITSPIQLQAKTESTNFTSAIKLPKLIETSSLATRAGLT